MSANVLFVFGLGFSARALATRLLSEGWVVRGTTRSVEKAEHLRDAGIEVCLFDSASPLTDLHVLDRVTHLLSSVPPGPDGDPVLNLHAADIAARAGQIFWAGYLSTTGVYGDCGGDWVDELTSPNPTTERGVRRVAAEAGWCLLHQAHGLPVHLFRLAGIYGPDRNALQTVRQGKARRIIKEGQVFSRTHVDDIVSVLEASIQRPNPGAAYNVCDDDPAPPQDVVLHACELLGVTPPPEIPFAEAELSEMARSFYSESKRVSNSRIKQELDVVLKYSNYRAGLEALLADS